MAKKRYIPSVIDLIEISTRLGLKPVPVEDERCTYRVLAKDDMRAIKWKIGEEGVEYIGFYLNNNLIYVCTDFVKIHIAVMRWLS